MSDNPSEYFPKGVPNDGDDPYTVTEHRAKIGQCYSPDPGKFLCCKLCGATRFQVIRGDYFTGIRCPGCKWEVCVHEG